MKRRKRVIIIAVSVIIVFIGIITLCSIRIVDGSKVGVVVRLGEIKDTPLQEGGHLVIPFITKVVEIDNHVLRTDVTGESASKDLQTIQSVVSINYQVLPEKSVHIYKVAGTDFENVILRPAAQECVKSVIARYTAEECITKRQEVSNSIKNELNSKVETYGLIVTEFNILDFKFSDEFNKAIEDKQTAQQQALKAEQDLVRIQVENQQKISQAEAEVTANKLKSQQLTDSILKDNFIKKWDGKLPAVIGDSSNIIDINSLIGTSK